MPNQLKKALTKKILSFSEFQLGKYCSDAYRKYVVQEYLASKRGVLSFKKKQKEARKQKEKEKNQDIAVIKEIKAQEKSRRFKRIHKRKPQ